jgi:hypothetical protein
MSERVVDPSGEALGLNIRDVVKSSFLMYWSYAAPSTLIG